MARRRRSAPRPAQPVAAPAPPAAESQRTHGELFTKRFWITIYVVIFLLVEGALLGFMIFTGGDQRVQDRLLLQAEKLAERGDYEASVEVLRDFANRDEFEGAWSNFHFLRRLGETAFAAGDYEVAAKNLRLALNRYAAAGDAAAESNMDGVAAMAGQALLQVNRPAEAKTLFEAELATGDSSNGSARAFLAQEALDDGDFVGAFAHFQAIKDREPYRDVIVSARAQMEATIMVDAAPAATNPEAPTLTLDNPATTGG